MWSLAETIAPDLLCCINRGHKSLTNPPLHAARFTQLAWCTQTSRKPRSSSWLLRLFVVLAVSSLTGRGTGLRMSSAAATTSGASPLWNYDYAREAVRRGVIWSAHAVV